MPGSGATAIVALVTCLGLVQSHPHFRDRVPNGYSVAGTSAVGHGASRGGGALCNFGADFKSEGFKWTQKLCEMDSDGDGESNGLELGDPCCIWTEGATATRTWRISHPGGSQARNAKQEHENPDFFDALQTHLPMPNCSDAHSFQQGKNSTMFWEFYYRRAGHTAGGGFLESVKWAASSLASLASQPGGLAKSSAGDNHGKLLFGNASVNIASAIILVELLVCLWLGTRSAWRRLSGREQGVLVFYSLLYMDYTSGLLHIILDNPGFNTWPAIGDSAIAFQNHHKDPTGITRGLYINFLREHHVLVAVCLGTFLFNPRHARLRIFLALAVPSSTLMMAAHRWAHTQPDDLGWLVRAGQSCGMLISQNSHSQHHVSYDVNFAILNGWSHPVLNGLTAKLLSARSMFWFGALVLWCLLPLILSTSPCARVVAADPVGRALQWAWPVAPGAGGGGGQDSERTTYSLGSPAKGLPKTAFWQRGGGGSARNRKADKRAGNFDL